MGPSGHQASATSKHERETRCTDAMNTTGAREQLTSSLKHETLDALLAGQVENSYPGGRVLLGEGEISNGVYVIHSGRVRISRQVNGSAGSSRIARPGEVVGLSTVVSGRPSEATAKTLGPSRLAFIPRDRLMKLMERDAEFAYRVVRVLCESLADPFDRLRPPRRRRRRRNSRARN